MSVSDQGAQFRVRDNSGVLLPMYPITKIEYVEGSIKTVNGKTPDGAGNIEIGLPTASSSTLGGIKIGTTLSMSEDGVVDISANNIVTALNYTPASVQDIQDLESGSGVKFIDDGNGGIEIMSLSGKKATIESK